MQGPLEEEAIAPLWTDIDMPFLGRTEDEEEAEEAKELDEVVKEVMVVEEEVS